jgi:hypothetical protein
MHGGIRRIAHRAAVRPINNGFLLATGLSRPVFLQFALDIVAPEALACFKSFGRP